MRARASETLGRPSQSPQNLDSISRVGEDVERRLQCLDHRYRQTPYALEAPQGEIALVAEEAFVAAIAGQHHRHVLARDLGDEVGRHRRGIRERLVEVIGEIVDDRRGIRRDLDLLVPRAVAFRDQPGVGPLVVARLVEADRVRAHRLR